MKKNKFIALTALTVALGMTACCGGGETEPCEKHTWGEYVETKAATCTEKGSKERTCEVCGEKETKEIGKKSHSYVEETAKRVEPTCTATGKKFSKCSVCGETKEDTLDMIDHDYDATVYTQQQSCTDDGVGTKTCKVCGHVENVREDALDHDWDETVVTQAATCTEDGVGTKTCKRCSTVEADNPKALGHHVVLHESEGEPPAGQAKVRLYECDREGCDVTYFGFKATETSPNAKELVEVEDSETGEVGKRFFGRPIGDNVELDENGDAVNKSNPTIEDVYDPTIEGDMFEYVFELTQEQVDIIGESAALYCDAKPADYLDGQDFWACNPSSDEYTPGIYIEGDKAGTRIDNYRYILYVNDEPVDFDPTIKAPVPTKPGASGAGNADLPRAEFIMPYVFHLKAGTNKISLRMAGGYKSIFYNFTFRPYVAPEIPPEPAKLGSWSAIDFTSASEGVEKNANGITMKNVYNVGTPGTSENNWTQTAPVAETDASEGDKVVYTVKADKAVTGAKLVMTVNYGQAYGTVPVFSKVANDGTKGYVWNGTAWNQTDYRYKVIVNGTEVELNAKAEGYEEPNFVANTDVAAEFPCTFDLNAGDNTIEIQNYGGYNPVISKFEIQAANGVDAKISVTPHAHDITYGDPVEVEGKTTTKVGTCSVCGRTFITMDATDLDGILTKGNKLPKGASNQYDGTAIARFAFNVETEGDYDIMINAAWDSDGNGARSFYDGKNGSANAFPMADGKTNTVMTINGEAVTLANASYASLAGVADNAAKNEFHDMIIARVHLIAGENVFTMTGTSSYGLKYNSISFVK